MDKENIKRNILECVGNTPLVRLNKIGREYNCELVVKCEFLNPGGSVKDRPAKQMVLGNKSNDNSKVTLIEPSSGNMGIGLALSGALLNIPVHITMPDKMSQEKILILKALGAQVHLTPEEADHNDPASHLALAEELKKEIKGSVILNQYTNENNPLSHYQTAEEILKDCNGRVDAIVAGAGTGGTITGISHYLKEHQIENIKIIGVDPEGSIFSNPATIKPQPYMIEGIGYDFIPQVLDLEIVDDWQIVSDKDAFLMARRLIKEEGLLVGGSSGAAVQGALQALKKHPNLNEKGKRIVIILPDSIRGYLTKFVSDDWMISKNFLPIPSGSKITEKMDIKGCLAGPLQVLKRSELSLIDKVTQFPLIVTDNNNKNVIVGLLTAPLLLKSKFEHSTPNLEKNYIILSSNNEESILQYAQTGYPVIVKTTSKEYFKFDLEKCLKK